MGCMSTDEAYVTFFFPVLTEIIKTTLVVVTRNSNFISTFKITIKHKLTSIYKSSLSLDDYLLGYFDLRSLVLELTNSRKLVIEYLTLTQI